MLVVEPDGVSFDGVAWAGVLSVAVNEEGAEVVAEGGDFGPHLTFVDVPARVVRLEVRQGVGESDDRSPGVGSMGQLSVGWSSGGRGGPARTLSATCVVTSSRYTFDAAKGATRVIGLVCVSMDGAASPVSIG